MTAPMPTRQQIDRAADLDFDAKRPARQELTITLHACFDGFAAELCFTGQIDQLPAIAKRIRELGGEPCATAAEKAPATAAAAEKKTKATRVEPDYDGSGGPICPKHKKPLKAGAWGLYCSAKDDSTDRGYCNLKFVE